MEAYQNQGEASPSPWVGSVLACLASSVARMAHCWVSHPHPTDDMSAVPTAGHPSVVGTVGIVAVPVLVAGMRSLVVAVAVMVAAVVATVVDVCPVMMLAMRMDVMVAVVMPVTVVVACLVVSDVVAVAVVVIV